MAAPSPIPKKAGERVKTNRRDAEGLAKLLRAGELTAVWVPDDRHEAMRELTRARDAVRQDLTRKRQQISSMLLRLGRHYPGLKTWNARHRSWLANLKLDDREQRFVLEELLQAERQAGERVERLEQAIREAVADRSLGPIVPALHQLINRKRIAPGDRTGQTSIRAEVGARPWQGNPRIHYVADPHARRPHLNRGGPGRTNGHAVSNPRIRDAMGRAPRKSHQSANC